MRSTVPGSAGQHPRPAHLLFPLPPPDSRSSCVCLRSGWQDVESLRVWDAAGTPSDHEFPRPCTPAVLGAVKDVRGLAGWRVRG